MATKVYTTFLTISPSRKSNFITMRFRRTYASAIAANASANNIPSAIVANASVDASAVMVADRLHNQATPWLMLPPEVDKMSGEKAELFYSLADGQTVKLNRKKSLKVPDTAKCVGSTKGSWLAYTDTKDGSFYLSNPFLNEVVELPSLEHLPSVVGVERERDDPNTGSILEFKVSYPDEDWHLWDNTEFDQYSIVSPEILAGQIFHLALSRDHPRDPDCVAMAMQGDTRRLAYTCIGKQFHPRYHRAADTCCINNGPIWYGLQEDYFPGPIANQVAYCPKKKLFYALFHETGILAFDVERNRGRRTKKVFQFRMFELEAQLERHFFDAGESESLKETRGRCASAYYLVTLDNGDLLLILRHYTWFGKLPHKTLHLDVFRVAYPGTLERVRSLEDRAIFIGHNQSFCIKAGASPGIRPNSIYFTDDINLQGSGHDIGIFFMEDGVISRACHPYQDDDDDEDEDEDKEEDKPVAKLTKPPIWVAPVSVGLLAFDKERRLPDDVFCHEG